MSANVAQAVETKSTDETQAAVDKSSSLQSGCSETDKLVLKGKAYTDDGHSSGTSTQVLEKVSAGMDNWLSQFSEIEILQDTAKYNPDKSHEVLSESSIDEQLPKCKYRFIC